MRQEELPVDWAKRVSASFAKHFESAGSRTFVIDIWSCVRQLFEQLWNFGRYAEV
jgi:hypothetical protein